MRICRHIGYIDRPAAISVGTDGKILVSGYVFEINDADTAFAIRYNPDGSTDQSYATKGIFKFTLGVDNDFLVGDHALDKNGNLFIAGKYVFSTTDFVLKLNNNGALDKSFGMNGVAEYPNGVWISKIAFQSDGKILLSGNYVDSFSVVRMNNDGTVDETFGINGRAIGAFGQSAYAKALTVQKNDEIIIGGSVSPDYYNHTYTPALAKFKATGLNDSAFGKNGLSVIITDQIGQISDLALQDDGKIVGSGDLGNRILLTRFENDNGRAHLYVQIKRWLHKHGIGWDDCPKRICDNLNYYSVQRSTNRNSFNEIARVYRSNNQQHYVYEDAAPLSGTSYYRLAAVSNDNSITYSNVIAIEDNQAAIKLYPNPVKNNLHVEGLSSTQKTKLTITDFSGIVKATTTITGNSYNWNIAQLKPGNYMLRFEANGRTAITKKFVKE